jgi:GMP synthase-like glutamine amidotransferase
MPHSPILKAHILQHVPFEGPGAIQPWLEKRGISLSFTRLYRGDKLPEPEGIELLVVMGGPMSVNDEALHPWLAAEKRFIREAVLGEARVLGVCLGAQLIASALDAWVHANKEKEIGWFPITAVPAPGCFRFPRQCTVFHWHGETFDLPDGAVRLAESPACANQAFQIGKRVIGLQFHLETTPEGVRAMIGNCGSDIVPAQWVQTAEEMREAAERRHAPAHAVMGSLLRYLLENEN